MRPLKDQRGVALVVGIIVGVVFLVGVGGFIWWRVMNAQQDTTANNSQQAATSATCSYSDQDICKFIAAWKASSDYRVESTITTDGEKATTLTFESTGQGAKTHQVMNADGVAYETIVIGDTTYTKDASDGKWWKQSTASSQQSAVAPEVAPDFDDPNGTGSKVEYKKLGTEPCGNRTCFKYQIIDSVTPDLTQYVWFDTSDYQLRRMRSETTSGSSDFTFSYENVSISEPSPTKDLPSGSYLNPTTGETISPPSGYEVD